MLPAASLKAQNFLGGPLWPSRRGHTLMHTRVFLHGHTLPANTGDLHRLSQNRHLAGAVFMGIIRTIAGRTAGWFQGPFISWAHLICRTVRSRPDSYLGAIGAQNQWLPSISPLRNEGYRERLRRRCAGD